MGYQNFAIGLLLASWLFICPNAAQAKQSDEEKYETKLEQLQDNISNLQKELNQVKNDRDRLRKQLKTTEVSIGELVSQIDQINIQLKQQRTQLQQLNLQQSQLQENLKGQQQQISQYINAAYRLGQQSQLKLLLNQEQPEQIARINRYYSYFLDAHGKKIDAFLNTIEQLEAVKPKIENQTRQLQENQQQLKQSHDTLLKQQSQRQSTLSKLNESISDKDQALKNLLVDKQQLERLLEEVSKSIASLALPDGGQSFKSQYGKMSLPTVGKTIKRFGQAKVAGKLNWEGILISASSGTEVQAVHYGRVVFSDYLRGHGLLIIIDHGDGYMSLYAHNQALLKETGDWVSSNEVIARVGNTGGQAESALYFEIRHQGKPADPAKWCRS